MIDFDRVDGLHGLDGLLENYVSLRYMLHSSLIRVHFTANHHLPEHGTLA